VCVRYTLHKTDAALKAISKALGVLLEAPEWAEPRYNVTLTSTMPVVALAGHGATVRPMRWGLIPEGDRGRTNPRMLANARSETAVKLPAFRRAIAARRCLVPANGYYEWKTVGGVKQPYLFTLRDEEPFSLAGIWEPADGAIPETYCILTTRPNELAALVHDRMPVILTDEAMRRWLGDAPLAAEELGSLVRPIGPERLQSRPVSRFVSNSRNEGPACHARPDERPPEPELNFG
jgi:putative SOS response-associated peptidase YedK